MITHIYILYFKSLVLSLYTYSCCHKRW